MRFILGLLSIVAAPVMAEPLMIDADRILGVYAADEYGDNDWNGDNHTDLAVLAISEAGDAVDLYLATSDPATGALRVTQVGRDILPYDPDRVHASYRVGPAHEAYEPEIEYRFGDRALLMTTNPSDQDAGLLSVRTYAFDADAQLADRICEIFFIDPYAPTAPGAARVIGPDGGLLTYDPGSAPLLATWHWRDALPAFCQGGGG